MPKDRKKKYAMMKLSSGLGIDFSKLGETPVKLERENNLKEYKMANDLDTMPKFGAGSEYGRDIKEEARRKKYGIILKKYNSDDQPWMLKVGSGKQAKKYKGVREGTITENTSYYIFTQCHDGAFEAFPVDEWYNFSPTIRYKYLNSEEAEEEFSRRDKTLNYFNLMVKKRMQIEDKSVEGEEGEKPKGKKKSSKADRDLQLTDMDDMLEMSDDDDRDSDDDGERDDENKVKKPQKGKQAGKGKRVKNAKQNSDDEAIEESDEGDYDDREVDYMSDSNSSSDSEPEEKGKKYEEKGVAEEAGLRKILDSDAEEEDEEETKEEEEGEEEKEKEEEKPAKEKKGGSDSSSSSSDSDSDIDKDEKITSALLMQKDRMDKKKSDKGDKSGDATDSKAVKRKGDGDGPSAKKSRTDSPMSSAGGSANEGITEDAIRRYLQRKPMTTKDLLQKFGSKKLNMTKEQMSHIIAQLLKRINPDRSMINKKLYLSLKKPE